MTTNGPRAPIDFDAFERDLRLTRQPQPEPVAAKADPLAELARIVGQDDPFRALLATRQQQAATGRVEIPMPPPRPEPRFDAAPPAATHAVAHSQVAHSQVATPADAFDQYLASVEQGAYDDDGAYDPAYEQGEQAHDQHDEPYDDEPPAGRFQALAAKAPRGRLVQVGAGLGVLMFCITGAYVVKGIGFGSGPSGPITVLADKTPLKIPPSGTDGVEIPDQNKQIYDRGSKDGQIKVVNREEQPLDVAQAARLAGRDGEGRNGVTPDNGVALNDSFGAPRRVRTVSIKPDAPPAAPPQAEATVAANDAPPPIPTMMLPDDSNTSTPAAAPPKKTNRTLAQKPVEPKPVADAGEAAVPPATDTGRRKPVRRVASADGSLPETTSSTTEAPPADPAPVAASSGGAGGWAVQIGVRNSETEAQAAFRQMQGKYSSLSGKPQLIQAAEVNGKSIYRVRVGPMAKAEAASLCTALKGDGGACYIAKN